jgi:hypothetical protein
LNPLPEKKFLGTPLSSSTFQNFQAFLIYSGIISAEYRVQISIRASSVVPVFPVLLHFQTRWHLKYNEALKEKHNDVSGFCFDRLHDRTDVRHVVTFWDLASIAAVCVTGEREGERELI